MTSAVSLSDVAEVLTVHFSGFQVVQASSSSARAPGALGAESQLDAAEKQFSSGISKREAFRRRNGYNKPKRGKNRAYWQNLFQHGWI